VRSPSPAALASLSGLLLALWVAACSSGAPPEPAAPPAPLEAAGPLVVASVGPSGAASADRGPAEGLRAFDPGVPPVRQGGNLLLVESPPRAPTPEWYQSTQRKHVEGNTAFGTTRVWVGREVPVKVPLETGSMELFLLDEVRGPGSPKGLLAFYREMSGPGGCLGGSAGVCQFLAAFFDEQGEVVWSLPLNPLFSQKEGVDVPDIRYAGGVLFFNQTCLGATVGASCGVLLAVDPTTSRVLWRTPRGVSEASFLLLPDYLVTAYGTSAALNRASLLDRATGKVVSSAMMGVSHFAFAERPGGDIEADVYWKSIQTLRITGRGGPHPVLRVVSRPTPRPVASASASASAAFPFPFPLPPGLLQGLPPGLIPGGLSGP
jgi:hypothetical protein